MNWLFLAVFCFLLLLFWLPRPFCFAATLRQEVSPSSFVAGLCPLRITAPCLSTSAPHVKLSPPHCTGPLKWLSFTEGWKLAFSLHQNTNCYRANNCLRGCKRETRAEFHFSWVYTLSAMLSSLRNWANHDGHWLRLRITAQLCSSSSRPRPLSKSHPKSPIVRPLTLAMIENSETIKWCPTRQPVYSFSRCPRAPTSICM